MSPTVVVRGSGSIGMRHMQVLRDRVGCTVIAVPMRAGRAESLAAAGYTVAASIQDAQGQGATLAVIATDTLRHLAHATEALQCGMDVLVEKPLAADSVGVRVLAELAERKGKTVHVACNLRFNRSLQRFRARLGAVGDVHAVRVECQSYLPSWHPGQDHAKGYSARANEGGVLRDLIHEVDYALWLYGRPHEVTCRMTNSGRLGIEAEESADLLWVTPSGAMVSMRLDYLTRTMRRRMTAFGAGGELEWDAVRERVDLRLAGEEPVAEEVSQPRDEMMQAQAEAFVLAPEGLERGLATLEEGAFAVALCDAARRSSRSGRMEPIEDWRTG